MFGSEIALDTHLENSLGLLAAAIALTVLQYFFYREGVYSKTGMMVGQTAVWFITVFMLWTLN